MKIDLPHIFRLHLTNRCNLRCKYCFQDRCDVSSMSLETLMSAMSFISKRYDKDRGFKVAFFGGEPMLEYDRLIKKCLSKVRELFPGENVSYSISTNGTLLNDDVIRVFRDNNFKVMFSYDGSSHDLFRKFGTFDSEFSIKQLRKLIDGIGSENVSVSSTIHHYNLDIYSIVKEIIGFGVKFIKLHFNFDPTTDFNLTDSDFDMIIKQVPSVVDLAIVNPDVNIAHYSLVLDENFNFITMRQCSACRSEVSISTNGDIYPCPLFVENKAFKIGNVNDGSYDIDMIQKISDIVNRQKNKCSSCYFKNICYGHCMVENGIDERSTLEDLDRRNHKKCQLFMEIAKEKIRRYNQLMSDCGIKKRIIF